MAGFAPSEPRWEVRTTSGDASTAVACGGGLTGQKKLPQEIFSLDCSGKIKVVLPDCLKAPTAEASPYRRFVLPVTVTDGDDGTLSVDSSVLVEVDPEDEPPVFDPTGVSQYSQGGAAGTYANVLGTGSGYVYEVYESAGPGTALKIPVGRDGLRAT